MEKQIMTEKDVKQVAVRQRITKIAVQTMLYLFLGFMALIIIFPFYWMIISSLKTLTEYEARVPTFFPKEVVWYNYVTSFKVGELGQLFMNTIYVGIVSTILSLVITVLSAFAFARLEFKGKNMIFAAMLATMMIPGELFTITNFITVIKLDWYKNGFTVLIVPFLVSIF